MHGPWQESLEFVVAHHAVIEGSRSFEAVLESAMTLRVLRGGPPTSLGHACRGSRQSTLPSA